MRRPPDQSPILETADDYRPVLLRLMGDLGEARLPQVIAEFDQRWGDLIPLEHREQNESGDVRWQHYVRWARQHLVNAGLMGSGGHGVWTITEAGREWLREHPDGGKDALVVLLRSDRAARRERSGSGRESKRLPIRLGGETFMLSQADVLTAVRAALAGDVPPEAKRFTSWFLPVDGERVSTKWVMSVATGLPVDRFITDDARRQLRRLGLEAQRVEQASADLGLRATRGRRPAITKGKDLDRPRTILAEDIRRIRACLNGDQAFSSDEKLCDWVQFCYTFELYAEGVALFRLVRPDTVHPWLYERTRRFARACELRGSMGIRG